MDEPDIGKFVSQQSPAQTLGPAIGFSKADFAWDNVEAPNFQLKDLNLNFPVGKLSLVVGPG